MSTKIYNAIKLDGITTIKGTFEFVNYIRPAITRIVHQEKANEIKALACLVYDSYHVSGNDILGEDDSRVPLIASVGRLSKMDSQTPENDYKFDICFAFARKTAVAITYFPITRANSVLHDLPNVSDFSYWNNADKEDEVSDEDWEFRKQVWDDVLVTSGIPSESMLKITLFNSRFLVPDDEFMIELPTIKQRLKMISNDIAYRRAIEEIRGNDENLKMEPHHIMKAANLAITKIRAEVEKELEPKINTELTIQDLEAEIPLPPLPPSPSEEKDKNGS